MCFISFIGRTISILSTLVVAFFLIVSVPVIAKSSESDENYQQFLSIYRKDFPTRSELNHALGFLQTAYALSPDTYKYVFSLGALNTTLKNWEEASKWLEKAKSLAITEEQRQYIEAELGFCQTQLAKLEVKNWGDQGVSISFIMKTGTVEMGKDTIMSLPKKLPEVAANESILPMEDLIKEAFHSLKPSVFKKSPFLIIGLKDKIKPAVHYEKGVKDFYTYFMNEYFDIAPVRPLVIIISPKPYTLVQATNQLYPEVGLPVYSPFLGYYNPSDNLIMATGGRSGYGTLLHEMIHALIQVDFPEAPEWLNEGLASLYERTQWKSGRLAALPNWRMNHMREQDIPSLMELAQKARYLGLHSHEIREIRLLLLYLDQRHEVDDLYKMAKQHGRDFDLIKAVFELGLTEPEWRAFLKNTFRNYHAEIAQNKGALSNPDEVRFLQLALNKIMDAALTVDGLWGGSTRAKLYEFQQRFNLKPDGILGPETLSQLKKQYTLERLNSFK